MRINHNLPALNAYRNLAQNQIGTSKILERLSSGYRINRASDDAAGLAISEKMRGQIRGLEQGQRNTMDGVSLIQTAEGALQEIHEMLQRMRELAVQAANGTYSDKDKKAIKDEINQLTAQIDQIAKTTEFNGIQLIGDSDSTSLQDVKIQYGPKKEDSLTLELTTQPEADPPFAAGCKADKASLQIDNVDVISDPEGAIETFKAAIDQVSRIRSYFGAIQNRLEHVVNNLSNYTENLTGAESRIRDADMAKEMTEFTRFNIINQSATAMLAQANQLPQGVLQLLKG
ncbi:flagellin [Aneurinibacillus thermoaerophilus]|uniref:flagellin N-terminal helical domain-containing protein n=1 Tax=Aneurinibacillus thermoaerophilus TaxID=143495 RepID=UPI002E1FC454|nr:flagellin [Aneurinibacillus thermoaerophilus]MED0678246.1 flagellin [Aneurinibacillus thermoaerophilus]MED0765282.1 flagellin [Aneurinibacillus thermoaerophilus]